MKKILLLAAIGFVMFGVSAAASWKWQQGRRSAMCATVEPEHEAEDAMSDDAKTAAAPEEHMQPGEMKSKGSMTKMPAATGRDRQNADSSKATAAVEESVQMNASLRDRMAAVRERELQLGARQSQIELIQQDIRQQRDAIDELRKQIADEVKAVDEHLAEVERKRTELDAEKQSMESRVTQLETTEKEGTKRLGSVYDGMAPDRAAKILRQMVDSGNMDTAVKLLGVMRERQAAKVLGEFEDESLAAQLTERLKGLKKTSDAPKK